MKKKLITLINNERTNIAINSTKATVYCTPGATDVCYTNEDHAHCTTYAYDVCGKDYAACYAGADDVCSNTDTTVCSGAGAEDNT